MAVTDEALRAELLAMERADRATRAALVERGELHGGGYHPEMAAVHRRHNARMTEIVASVGWPGRSLVGDDGCRAAGFIIQHAILDPALQRRSLPLLEAAVATDEAFPPMLAFLTDRVLMERGRPQRYGTQHIGGPDGTLIPWPISDPETVDARRKALGLDPLAARTAELQRQVDGEQRARTGG
ncbi:MAG TPA: DUF6624 domain-containing protein [Thermomicrobiales bacterium]